MKIKPSRALMVLALLQAPAWAQLQVDEIGPQLGDTIQQVGGQEPTSIVESSSPSSSAEVVRERYSDGKLHIERQVAIAGTGDFVNHGTYREYSAKGDVLVEGKYEWGVMTGTWIKHLDATECKKVQQQLDVAFKTPFLSTAEFVSGKLNNVWTIVDKDNKVIVQIELKDGQRDGLSTVYAAGGEIKSQQSFVKGVLSGSAFEKLEGKNARDEQYTEGRKVLEDTQRQPNGSLKSMHTYLSPVHRIVTPDNWMDSTFGKIVSEGDKTLHGAFIIYFENGKIASKGRYTRGQLDGDYESWHRNGEVAITGRYERGLQTGTWVWRHPNGMKESVANYVDGKPQGRILAWDQNGKAINNANVARTVPKEDRSAAQPLKNTIK